MEEVMEIAGKYENRRYVKEGGIRIADKSKEKLWELQAPNFDPPDRRKWKGVETRSLKRNRNSSNWIYRHGIKK
ncbi:Acetyl-CoA decarbonylase/synthase complex subunit gamma [Trichinella spiralis]|uniref:Acetyl-CoA decarbonylase/synthase complex subunit gamma n=1 Tax=Trichinella spiralis TaxID=6334 RepID=A0ABR3KDY2_TRISP